MTTTSGDEAQRAHLRVVSGNPTPEELAALTVVLAAASSASADDQSTPRSRWSIPAMRRPLAHGPGGWRASAGMR